MREHHHNDQSRGKIKKCFLPIWISIVIASFALSFAAGYGLSVSVFGQRGLAAHIISGFTGLLAFFLMVTALKMIAELHDRKNLKKRLRSRALEYNMFLSSTMDAMSRIAHGDFNIFIPVEEEGPFSKIAESVNEMARGLSSMEQLRQDFISNVSHEIQSPLTSISGFAALLKNPGLSDELREHYIDIIETESNRLSKLSANLLKLSSLESDAIPMAPREYRLDKQLESTVLMLEPQWSEKNLNPCVELPKISFFGDEELLSQVWINLLHNAIKFTPEGGEFGITLTSGEKEITCAVYDNGIGIPQEDQLHIFERFYKVDKSRDRSLGGNGLGLSLVKKIVDLHGGAISLQSEAGQGTVFTVTLPVKK